MILLAFKLASEDIAARHDQSPVLHMKTQTMSDTPAPHKPVPDADVLRRLLMLFVAFCAVCLLAGASRMSPPAWQLAPAFGPLRIREALSMFVFAPAVTALAWFMVRALARGRPHCGVEALMVLAVCFIACGMGIHDPANLLGSHASRETPVGDALHFLDDGLSHWVFWCGFVLGSWVFGIQQLLSPLREKMGRVWRCGFGAVTAALLWVMLTNLWDEYPKTRADLCVIAAAAAVPLAFHLAARRDVALARLPVLCVIYPAYLGSIVGTLICWLARYGKI